jgi:hypothetical protein
MNPMGRANSGLGLRTGASLRKMVALTGVAPVSPGLKDRDPALLPDKAEWSAASTTSEEKSSIAALLTLTKRKRAAGLAV